ncbi:MAG: peptidoglycan-binding protein LysM [Pseudomonadota bacterium]
MAGTGASSVGPMGIAGAGAVVVAIVAGLFFLRPDTQQEGAAPPAAEDAAQVVEEVANPDVPSDAAAGSDAAAAEPSVETPEAPRFDVVRVDAGGQTIVAGTGAPGSRVEILIDGEMVGEALVDGSGQFAALLDIAPADLTRTMSLRGVDGDTVVASSETVIVGAVVAEVAEAATETGASDDAAVSDGPAVPVEEAEGETSVAAATATERAEGGEAMEAPVESAEAAASTEAQDDAESVAAVEVEGATTESAEATGEVVSAAPAAPQVLLADDEGIRVLQSPEAMTSVALDTITYTDEGDVSLGGRALGDGFVRIYIDDQPITTSRIEADGSWRTALPEVDTGVYTLRVDELDDEGAVTSRVETPFKREDPDVLAEAVAQTPEGGSLVSAPSMTVQPGATLWAIAREKYGEGRLFVKVFEANRGSIQDPDLIFPGQVFDLPD